MERVVPERDELYRVLAAIATHPITFGIAAGIARWIVGRDKNSGGDAPGVKVFASLTGQVIASIFVAYSAALYLNDEGMTDGRRNFYVLLIAFVAKDLLLAMVAVGAQFAKDPFGVVHRIREALRGSKP